MKLKLAMFNIKAEKKGKYSITVAPKVKQAPRTKHFPQPGKRKIKVLQKISKIYIIQDIILKQKYSRLKPSYFILIFFS